jgi:hypothetical protein
MLLLEAKQIKAARVAACLVIGALPCQRPAYINEIDSLT